MALPEFATERLLLRQRRLADTDACLAMDRAPEVTRFLSGPWQDPTAHRAFIEARTRGPYPDGLGYWSIFAKVEPGHFLGWVLLIPVDAIGPEIEIGWRLVPEYWGQGIATEAARSVLAYAFAQLRFPEVVADIDAENAGSLRVADKLGLRRRGLVVHAGRPAVHLSLRLGEAEAAGQSGSAGRFCP